MKKFWLFCLSLHTLFGKNFNYAPKVENPIEEKPMVVVIASYNNKRYFKGNLDSVFSQKYDNYRVIYTSDASTDSTAELVRRYIQEHEIEERITFINNEKNIGAVANIYNMVTSCANDEIILLLDGDDKFYHDGVLKRVNQAYAEDEVWMTYGSDWSPLVKRSHSKPTDMQVLRDGRCKNMRWSWSHLRTFYAGLYKKIPVEKLQKDGKFLGAGGDVALMHALLELGREHVFYIPEILYYYNTSNPICDFKIDLRNQQKTRNYVWNQEPLEGINSKEDFL